MEEFLVQPPILLRSQTSSSVQHAPSWYLKTQVQGYQSLSSHLICTARCCLHEYTFDQVFLEAHALRTIDSSNAYLLL